MPRRRNQHRELQALIARLQPELQLAFLAGVAELRAGIDYSSLLAALRSGDVNAAIASLQIEPAAWQAFTSAKAAAFAEAGATTAATITGVPTVRFDMSNPRAENWIRRNVGEHITEVANDTILAARETILTGYASGRHPNNIATDLVGRVQNGRRTGGVIGLDTERARRLNIVTRGMETPEGVADLVVKRRDGTLSVRYKVNKQTENRILAAYKKGEAVPKAQRDQAAKQYENALLKSRAETIARTETAQAVRGGQMEEWRILMDRRNLPPEAVIKTWIHGGGVKDPRPHHVAMNGKSVRGLDTPFTLPNGYQMDCPHDSGASASETINCTCSMTIRLDATWGLE